MARDPIEEIFRNSLWKTPPVSAEPVIHLARWRVLEVRNKDQELERHFVGYNLGYPEGRASTAIQQFDPATGQGVTLSGRVYQLVGPPGYDHDAAWVWVNWSRMNQFTNEKDVSREYWDAILADVQREEKL